MICKQFFDFYDYYVDVCTENSSKDGTPMTVCRLIEESMKTKCFHLNLGSIW